MSEQPPILRYASPKTATATRRPFWPRSLRDVKFGCLLIGVLLAIVFGIAAFSSFPFKMGTDTKTLTHQQIEAIGEFKLPPGAADVRAHYDKGKDFILKVRFTIPADQVDAFVASTHIATPLSGTDIPLQFGWETGRDKPWWKPPQRPAHFLAGHFDGRKAATRPVIYQSILIDQSDPNRYTVWFIANDD